MAKHLKIFHLEPLDPDLIIRPIGEGPSFRYADLQMEANYIRTMVADPKIRNVVIDLGDLSYFGSEFIGALITICREKKNRGGAVGLCNAREEMKEVLENMSLYKLWPYFETQEEAITTLAESSTEAE